LDEAKLDKKAGNKQVFFGYRHDSGMTAQNRHHWPGFFYKETIFENLG